MFVHNKHKLCPLNTILSQVWCRVQIDNTGETFEEMSPKKASKKRKNVSSSETKEL